MGSRLWVFSPLVGFSFLSFFLSFFLIFFSLVVFWTIRVLFLGGGGRFKTAAVSRVLFQPPLQVSLLIGGFPDRFHKSRSMSKTIQLKTDKGTIDRRICRPPSLAKNSPTEPQHIVLFAPAEVDQGLSNGQLWIHCK